MNQKKSSCIIIKAVVILLAVSTLPVLADDELYHAPPSTLMSLEQMEPMELDFETALGVAITLNFELKAIHARKEAFTLNIWEKFRDYFPTLSVSYLKNQETSVHDADSRTRQITFESNLVVYDGGKRGLAFDIAKLESILARNDYRIALNKLVMQVQETYLAALQAKGAIEIHKMTLEQGKLQLSFIAQERDLGEATELNVLEIGAKVKEIELNLEQARNEYVTAMNRLKLIMKVDWRQPLDLRGDIDSDYELHPLAKAGEPVDVHGFVATALKNRKEVESADVEHAISRSSFLMDRLYFFPKFSLGAKYTLSDDDPANGFIPKERGWGISLKVSTALWGNTAQGGISYDSSGNGNTKSLNESGSIGVLDSVGYKKKMVESRIAMNTAKEKKMNMRQQISLEVFSSIVSLENTWTMMDIAKKRVELYDSLLAIERLKATMGETIRYELIKKEIDRDEAAVAYLDTKVKYMMTATFLEVAMGLNVGELKLSKQRSK